MREEKGKRRKEKVAGAIMSRMVFSFLLSPFSLFYLI